MTDRLLPQPLIAAALKHAEREYPNECCGIMLGPQSLEKRPLEVYPCRNIQDECRARDPKQFPRSAAGAYFMDPFDLVRIQKEARAKGLVFRVFFHSHVDGDSYFSSEDIAMALWDGEPLHPDVLYMVISVIGGQARNYSLYLWDANTREFSRVLRQPV